MALSPHHSRSLIIDSGDLGSLAAIATRERPERCVLWHVYEPNEAGQRRRHVATEHAVIYAIDDFVQIEAEHFFFAQECEISLSDHSIDPFPLLPIRVDMFPSLESWGMLLLHAAIDARRLACGEIIWPIHMGNAPLDRQSQVTELQTLITHIFELDSKTSPIAIDLPFLDLTDAQVIDLAVRADAPMRAAWWCVHAEIRPCGGCDGCMRWEQAFGEAGITDPWHDSIPTG